VQAFIDGGGASTLPAVIEGAGEIVAEVYRADRQGDPTYLGTAVRIVLDMATHNMLSDDSEEMADEVTRQTSVVSLAQQLAANHGDDLVMPSAPKVG
jgi:hypothetical protein